MPKTGKADLWLTPKQKKCFPFAIFNQIVGVGKLFVRGPAIQPGFIQSTYTRFSNVNNFIQKLV